MRSDILLVWLHVTGNIFWVGAIVAVAVIVLASQGDAKLRGELASKLYMRAAVPAFVLSFGAGVARLVMDSAIYLKQPWMHAKLTVALVVIAIHHIIGARAKRMAKGDTDEAGPTKILLAVLVVCAVAATFFVVTKKPERSAEPAAAAAQLEARGGKPVR